MTLYIQEQVKNIASWTTPANPLFKYMTSKFSNQNRNDNLNQQDMLLHTHPPMVANLLPRQSRRYVLNVHVVYS